MHVFVSLVGHKIKAMKESIWSDFFMEKKNNVMEILNQYKSKHIHYM